MYRRRAKRYTRVCASAATVQMSRTRRRLFQTKFALVFMMTDNDKKSFAAQAA